MIEYRTTGSLLEQKSQEKSIVEMERGAVYRPSPRKPTKYVLYLPLMTMNIIYILTNIECWLIGVNPNL